jgi:hypothetical protein
MGRTCEGNFCRRPRSGRGAAKGGDLAGRFRRLVLRRAVKKTMRSIERHPHGETRLLRDIGLGPDGAEWLASQLQVLAADPFHICLNPRAKATKRKWRSR